ncbi:hypothetical protein F4054_04445 [Candidatus Poribacteria bacterium]|nr:hypothetical protein [Candidatus Poribacteria bacterium]MYG06059.1 hypothetical protein [Candidatus Poribacteria bacterium]MYK21493.1 hypothetical protein [Candidatus Poribacteria bacterium]
MSQPIDTHRTAKDLSPEELAAYRQRLDQHFQNRKVDEALLQRAWQTAHRVAAMLYEDFGVTQVAVFGSLTKRKSFSKWSDVNIVVWGIPNDKYFQAVWEAEDISRLFEIDLVDFESCPKLLRERIESQAVSIGKGEIYPVDRSQLIQDISDECPKIEISIKGIQKALWKIKTAPLKYRRAIEITMAKYLSDCYMGMENIFRQIALEVDLWLPDGSREHKALLVQMAAPYGERPPVISEITFGHLQEFLEFRYLFLRRSMDELDYQKTKQKAKQVSPIFDIIFKELNAFIAYLEKQEND